MNPKGQSTYQSTSQTTSRTSQYYDDSSGKAFIRTFLKILYVLGCLAALYFAYLNINPYVAVVGKLLSQTDVTGFGRFIGKIPLIGGVARALGASSQWIFGIVLWGFIQFAQCAPIVLFRDKALLRVMLDEHDRAHRVPITEKDDPVAVGMKSAYNKLPLGILRNLGKIRIAAYILDFVICSIVYPPCEGGFLKFVLYLSTGAFQRLNWTNITLTLCTMFAIEVILRVLLGIGALIYFYRKSRT
jgi:hypothetical protein